SSPPTTLASSFFSPPLRPDDERSILQTRRSGKRFRPPRDGFVCGNRLPRGLILRSIASAVMQFSYITHAKLVFCTWERHYRELGIRIAAHRHRFKHFNAVVSLAAILVSRSLARHLALGSSSPSLRCSSGPRRSSAVGICDC